MSLTANIHRPARHFARRLGGDIETMLPRRRMAFSHVIYTSGVFFLTVAFALIAVVALTLRFAGGPQVLKAAKATSAADEADTLKHIGGSPSDARNNFIGAQALASIRPYIGDEEKRDKMRAIVTAGLTGI